MGELRESYRAIIALHARGRLVRLVDFMAGATLSHAPASKWSAVTAGSESGLKLGAGWKKVGRWSQEIIAAVRKLGRY